MIASSLRTTIRSANLLVGIITILSLQNKFIAQIIKLYGKRSTPLKVLSCHKSSKISTIKVGSPIYCGTHRHATPVSISLNLCNGAMFYCRHRSDTGSSEQNSCSIVGRFRWSPLVALRFTAVNLRLRCAHSFGLVIVLWNLKGKT